MSLDAIFKAYDVRGLYPEELDEALARRIGNAFAHFTGAQQLIVGHDMRPSSEPLSAAFIEGATLAGADVTDIGLCSTDVVYFAAGKLDAPGAMFTASHNPAQYNGIKLCRAGAAPVGEQTGLTQIKEMVEAGVTSRGESPGKVEQRDLLEDFGRHVRSFSDTSVLRPLKVVADTANGMGGLVVPKVFEGLPFSLTVLYGELDGTFPNHPADPIQPENLKDLQRGGARPRRRRRSRVRRRRRPCLPRRRRRAGGERLDHDRHRRGGHPRPSSGRDRRAQPHLLACGGRDRAGARRRTRPHARRALVHQAGHGRDRRDLRRRALRALLLPRQLARRQRLDRGAARARAALPRRRPALGAAQAVRALRAERRDQLARRRSAGRDRAGRRRRTPRCRRTGSTGSPSMRASGGSTCDRATPSRCCASTSKRPTPLRASSTPTRCWSSYADSVRVRFTVRRPEEARHGARSQVARDPRVPRGQGSAAVLRRRGHAVQPAVEAACTASSTATSRTC